MKKVLSVIIILAIIFSLAGCVSNSATNDDDITNTSSKYNIDYNDAETFESALNDGAKVKGKVVRFYVKEYAPDSILGINCHAGEHLNFLFENELYVEMGDTIVVRITEEPSKVFLIGSWEVPCEFIEIVTEKQENNTNKESSTESQESDNDKETTIQSEDMLEAPDAWTNLLEKHYTEVKKQFEDAGFTNITCVAHEIDYNENNVFEGSVVNIAIGENGEICTFEKGEQWSKDIKIRIDYRVKPTTTVSPDNNTNPTESDIDNTCFVFGQYEQDGNTDNGAEPIEWIMLKEEGNKKLLISRYILDYQEFNDTTIAQGTSWKNSTLRKWLNNDFLDLAFSSNEQKQIISSKVQDYKADSVLGDITTDKVFILNKEQAFTLFSSDYNRATTSTNYAKSRKSYVTNAYWLINSYSSDLYKYLINDEGVNENNPRVNESEGVRPVIWINN